MKKFFFLFLLMFTQTIYAEACPTPLELQAGNFNEWKLLDIDNASPLSDEQTQAFIQKVQSFALAEWSPGAPEGSAHCFYQGNKNDPQYLNAFLAKDNLKPLSPEWKYVNDNIMQCTAGVGLCLFQTS